MSFSKRSKITGNEVIVEVMPDGGCTVSFIHRWADGSSSAGSVGLSAEETAILANTLTQKGASNDNPRHNRRDSQQ